MSSAEANPYARRAEYAVPPERARIGMSVAMRTPRGAGAGILSGSAIPMAAAWAAPRPAPPRGPGDEPEDQAQAAAPQPQPQPQTPAAEPPGPNPSVQRRLRPAPRPGARWGPAAGALIVAALGLTILAIAALKPELLTSRGPHAPRTAARAPMEARLGLRRVSGKVAAGS